MDRAYAYLTFAIIATAFLTGRAEDTQHSGTSVLTSATASRSTQANSEGTNSATSTRVPGQSTTAAVRKAVDATKPLHQPSGHWGYAHDDDGLQPHQWGTFYPTCSGKRQSPVEIQQSTAIPDRSLTPLALVDYDDIPLDNQVTLLNNGHAVQFSAAFPSAPQLQRGGLPGKYSFLQGHFHWGSSSTAGSEHLIDGKSYPLELHLVHKRKNDSDPINSKDGLGLAVLGIMFELTSNATEVSPSLNRLFAEVPKIRKPGSKVNVSIPDFHLYELCPRDLSYYRYLGSLTTPPCSESVVWTVLMSPLKITEEFLQVLRTVLAKEGHGHESMSDHNSALLDNYRPVQPMFGRKVRSYTERPFIAEPRMSASTTDVPTSPATTTTTTTTTEKAEEHSKVDDKKHKNAHEQESHQGKKQKGATTAAPAKAKKNSAATLRICYIVPIFLLAVSL